MREGTNRMLLVRHDPDISGRGRSDPRSKHGRHKQQASKLRWTRQNTKTTAHEDRRVA